MFLGGSFANMVIKCKKAISPFLANINTSPPVIFKVFIVRILTTVNYMKPTSIFRGAIHTMRSLSLYAFFLSQAATTFCGVVLKISANNYGNIATRAFAFPASSPKFIIFNSFKNSETTKDLSGKIDEIVIGHKKYLQAKVASIWVCGRRLLEYRFSDALSYPQNDNIFFSVGSQ